MVNIAFRLDSSGWIGTGHVMRCLPLADSFQKPEAWTVIAEILPKNIPSRKAFEKASYVLHHSVYEKKLEICVP